jgi:hypothetical protein
MEALVNRLDIVKAVKLIFDVLQPVDDIAQLLSWCLLLIVSNINVNVFCEFVSIKQRKR